MATNYTIEEAVKIIAEGKNAEAIQEIGRRFPILAVKIAGITAKAKDEFVDFMSFMPEYLTANKVNSEIKKTLIAVEDEKEDEDTDKPAKAAKSEKKAAKADAVKDVEDYTSMTGKQLWAILGEKGLQADCKKKCGTKKAELLEYIEKYGLNGTDGDEDVDADDDAEEENPYAGKSAMDLYKECKKRGIKAAPKKKADFYANLLIEDDAASADEDDDDWGDEEDTEPVKPQKPAKGGKGAKKAAKVEEEDDDDDWDI